MDMSPMIDMVFLLLIFFIVASSVIVVKQDAKVDPPIAMDSKRALDGKGRIVINVREDGTFLAEDTSITFPDIQSMADYIEKKKKEEESKGNKPLLHLRGDKKATFKHARKVLNASARAKVDKIIFSVYGFEKK